MFHSCKLDCQRSLFLHHLPELMDQRVLEAAKMGDTEALHSLLREDPEALEKATLLPLADTPLHVATFAGKTQFVERIIELKPSFAWNRNQDGLTPLHIASALGHIEKVGLLLQLGSSSLCLIQDNKGWIRLHHATINGKVQVIDKLILQCPKALKVVTACKETCFHLALISSNQVAALEKLLQGVGDDLALLYAENEHGYSIYELAQATNQSQVLSSFTKVPKSSSMRLQNIFSRQMRQLVHPEIQQVVASVIATVTFQAVSNPPSSIWKEGMKIDYRCHGNRSAHWGHSPFEFCPAASSIMFMAFNTAGFLYSVMFISFFKRGGLANICMMASLMSLLGSYLILLFAMSPDGILAVSIPFLCFLILYVLLFATLGRQKKHGSQQSMEASAELPSDNALEFTLQA